MNITTINLEKTIRIFTKLSYLFGHKTKIKNNIIEMAPRTHVVHPDNIEFKQNKSEDYIYWKKEMNVSSPSAVIYQMYHLKNTNPELLRRLNSNFGPYSRVIHGKEDPYAHLK